jgi:hypothetical protein
MKILNSDELNIVDNELSDLLKEVYSDDLVLNRPERAAEIMKTVRYSAAPDLIDLELTSLLHEAYTIDPIITDSIDRTAKIMSVVRSASRQESYLGDVELSELLKESYIDDPVLIPAPGRTHRIMRKISSVIWRPMINFQRQLAFATVALSAAMVIFFVQFQNSNQTGESISSIVVPGDQPQSDNSKLPIVVVNNPPFKKPDVSVIKNNKIVTLSKRNIKVENFNIAKNIDRPNIVKHEEKKVEVNVARIEPSTQRIAATLYSSGTIAHASGDYTTAYDAYLSSYELSPSPEALLASGQALVEDAKVVINKEVNLL